MVDWTVPKTNKKKLESMVPNEPSKEILDKLPPPNETIEEKEVIQTEELPVEPTNWTNEYPTEYGMTAFRRDKILGVTDNGKAILVHMVNGHTYTITIKESIIPFFNRDGLTTADVLNDLKSD